MLPDFFVLIPDPGDGGRVNSVADATFPRPGLIIWLDELQRFLDGPGHVPGDTSVTAGTVRRLLDAPSPVVLLGSMWSEHSRKATTSGARSADILTDPRVRRTTLAGISEGEREAARELADRDPRLKKALADPVYNVTQALAGAPQLVTRYREAPEEQRALLEAAADARRLGIESPLTPPAMPGWTRLSKSWPSTPGRTTTPPRR